MEKPPRQPPGIVTRDVPSSHSVGIDALKAFLRANPDALDDDRELLSLLTPPAHRRGHNVVDLQSFMIERLRARDLEREAREDKIRQAIAADALDERRVQKAALAISGARSFEALISVITNDLAPILGASVVTLNIERPAGASSGIELAAARAGGPIQLIAHGAVERLLGAGSDVKVGAASGDAPLFPRAKGVVRSYVAARLTFTAAAPAGLLAIGSKASGRFSKSIGLHRYSFLARLVESGVKLWLDLPPGS
ncbi:MAG: DUF484 family protein [Alphaproteobacteria bacterium]